MICWKIFGFCLLFLVIDMDIYAQDNNIVYFSAVQGEKSRIAKLIIDDPDINNIHVTGAEAALFKLVANEPAGEQASRLAVSLRFEPDPAFKGIARATLQAGSRSIAQLNGLCTTGIEGNHEASLKEIFNILNISTNPGWTTLANHTLPELLGDEIRGQMFKKSSGGQVEIIPVARFSPPYALPYGFYLDERDSLVLHRVAVLSDSKEFHEHQTLFPQLQQGKQQFDPGEQMFGLFVESPTHTSYTQDHWNIKRFPDHVAHASRIYQVIDQHGGVRNHEYLVCFEEASNGDYQDYIFLIKNVVVVPASDR